MCLESASGSIIHRYGSEDPHPDPYQNVMDSQHCTLPQICRRIWGVAQKNILKMSYPVTVRFTGLKYNIYIFGENNDIFLFKFKQTGVRRGQPIHQGGDVHVHGKVAALLHLRDHAWQATLRHQLCAGSAQRLANACQDFPASSGKKNRPQERKNKMCFFIKCIPENAYNYNVYIAFGDKLKVTKIFRSTEADRLFLKIRPQFHRRYDRLLYWSFYKYGRRSASRQHPSNEVHKYTPIFVNQNGKFRNLMNIRNSVLTIKDYRWKEFYDYIL